MNGDFQRGGGTAEAVARAIVDAIEARRAARALSRHGDGEAPHPAAAVPPGPRRSTR
jgi:hypothetical protein